MEKQPWTYEQILDLFAETDKKFEASNKELNRKFEASNKAMDKKFDELRKFIKNVSRQVGEITDTLGRFAEEQISPRVLEFFQERGIDLREVYQRVVVKDEHQQF
ncbi:MAG: hypothetical protein JJT94_08005, partial [Bernardetiaceae bacterium]|nr:hypothetical protein [Bernardetiaceae bacterium]